MNPGESLEECCRREVWEETGLLVRVVRLIGISSTPHRVTSYADGHRRQTVSVTFLTHVQGVRLNHAIFASKR
jgi:ADP-ribose pyrophosphatase YjhB (NUDIX family)